MVVEQIWQRCWPNLLGCVVHQNIEASMKLTKWVATTFNALLHEIMTAKLAPQERLFDTFSSLLKCFGTTSDYAIRGAFARKIDCQLSPRPSWSGDQMCPFNLFIVKPQLDLKRFQTKQANAQAAKTESHAILIQHPWPPAFTQRQIAKSLMAITATDYITGGGRN